MLAAETLPNLPELTVAQAEHWVAAALAEASALRQHDEQLFPPGDDPAAARAAALLRAAWRRWADGAEALFDRVRPLLKSRRHVAGAHDLDYAIGRARAMLGAEPETMRAREEQARLGETKPIEEVRLELRAADRG